MKKFLLAILIITLFPTIAGAVSLGGPLNVEINNAQNIINQELKNSLIAKYGALFYSCVDNTPSPYPAGMDQYQYGQYLNTVQMKLAYGNQAGCYAKTNDQICQGSYGKYGVWTGKKADNGNLICDCASGYGIDSTGQQCIAIIPAGIQCNGKYWNDCSPGQKFYCPSVGDAQCVVEQPINITVPDRGGTTTWKTSLLSLC